MSHAYDEKYLYDAMRNLGEAFDFATNDCNISMDEFLDMFITTGIGELFGKGTPKFVAGMSGVELVYEVFWRSGKTQERVELEIRYDRSPEYWSGWVLAYYQWYTGKNFKKIKTDISMDEICGLYNTHHEASEDKFVYTVNKYISKKNPRTQLQTLRRLMGYSQKVLGEKSGVSLRMIQQYEQRAKDINNASVSNLIALAQALGCKVEDLIEPTMENETE